METEIELFKVVALLNNITEKKLKKGQVGTVVKKLAEDVYEIEFCDKSEQTILTTSIHAEYLLVLDLDLVAA